MDEQDFTLFKKGKKNKDDIDQSGPSASAKNSSLDSSKQEVVKISRPAGSSEYDSTHVNPGIALIFNQKKIRGQKERNGTDRDRDRFKKILRVYGFEVRTFNDLNYMEIMEILHNVSKEDHSDSDCFVVAVMTHGLPGQIFAADRPYKVEQLWKPFLGDQCHTLVNKPKLFFIQACRGEDFDDGVSFMRSRSRALFDQTDANVSQVTYTIPTTADLLVMYSTFEGNYSWRNSSNGSWFMQSLCAELEEAEKFASIELYRLLTAVARRVAFDYQSNVPVDENMDQMKQMPSFVSTLTKMFYLTVKN